MLNPKFKNIGVVILSAGKGTRLNSGDKPKVMQEIGGKPIVSYVVRVLKNIGFTKDQVCLVVGFKKEIVKDYFKDEVAYADQTEQLGTAHAAYTGMKKLDKNITQVLVLNGDDSAFYKKESLEDFIKKHKTNKNTLSLLSVDIEKPEQYGRVVKINNKINIIEKEDLDNNQKKIKEISTGTFCFDRNWFESNFSKMPKMKNLDEYGLPTAVEMVNKENKKIQVIKLENNNEWFGINNLEELKKADVKKQNNN